MNVRTTLALSAALLALGGCSSIPKPLQGTFDPTTPADVVQTGAIGGSVRWSGRIIETVPEDGRTCFTVLAQPAQGSTRPRNDDRSLGRFIACRSGFYDPEVFAAKRQITVTGTVTGIEPRTVGDARHPHPIVAADVVYLWREARSRTVLWVEDPWMRHPWMGPHWVPVPVPVPAPPAKASPRDTP